jgi:hypothetical protein
MAQAIDLGRLRFFHRGAYASGTTYELNDVVSYGAKSYVYISQASASGNLPTNATYWSQMADGISPRGAWATGTVYFPGDVVISGGSTYLVLTAHTSAELLQTDVAASRVASFASGFDWRGAWAGSAVYKIDDVVFADGNAYISIADFTSDPTTFANNSGNWELFSQGGTGEIPSQSGSANSVLKTDGTEVSWTNSLSIVSATLSGTLTADAVTANNITSNANIFVGTGALVGANAGAFANTLTNPTVVVQSNAVDYSQIAFRNLGTDANSSTDFIAYADLGDDDSGWIDMGITSSNFSDESFTITGDHDGYIFMEAPASTSGNGNLVIATGGNGTQNKIVFAAGGLSSNDTQMVITPNTSVAVNIATNSVSATTGALVVAGGLGVGGNVYINGNTNIVGTITVGGGAFESNNLTVSDPIVFMGNTNTGDTFDLGFAGKFDDGAVKYAGLLRDASDGKFKLFTDLTTAPTSTANFAASSNASLVVADLEASGDASVTGNATVSGDAIVSKKLSVTTISEPALVSATASTGTISIDYLSNPTVLYTSDSTANWTLNVRGNASVTMNNSISTGDIATVVFMATNGATPYYANTVSIDGITVTPKWQNAIAPASGNANSIDAYTLSIFKTAANTYTVFASQSRFG